MITALFFKVRHYTVNGAVMNVICNMLQHLYVDIYLSIINLFVYHYDQQSIKCPGPKSV